MIQMRTTLDVADNSGARRVQVHEGREQAAAETGAQYEAHRHRDRDHAGGHERRDEEHHGQARPREHREERADQHVEHGIVVRAAPPSGLACRLMQDDVCFVASEADGSGQPGEAGTHHMHAAGHQTKACRMMIHNSRARGMWIGRRGEDQPRSTRLSRIIR